MNINFNVAVQRHIEFFCDRAFSSVFICVHLWLHFGGVGAGFVYSSIR